MRNQCEHGQLGRACLMCEMRDENERLKREGLEALQEWAETETGLQAEIEALRAKLADCQSIIRDKGHDADCPAASSACAICGLHELLHPCVTYFGDSQKHNFNRGPCSDTCGHDRTTGEKA